MMGGQAGGAKRRARAFVMAALAFGRDRRLSNHGEFVRAQRSGRRVAAKHFTLLIARQPSSISGPRPPRIGLVVARKVGGAVQRNRIKRLCRECFRLWPDMLPQGVDLIVIARPGAHELSLSDVRSEWVAVHSQLQRRAAEALAQIAPPHHPGVPK
jgi:ribonuclease P protein component